MTTTASNTRGSEPSPIEPTSRWSISTCSTVDFPDDDSRHSILSSPTRPPNIWIRPPSPPPKVLQPLEPRSVVFPDAGSAVPHQVESPSVNIMGSCGQDATKTKRPCTGSKPLPQLPVHTTEVGKNQNGTKTRHTSVFKRMTSLASSRWSFVPGHHDPKETIASKPRDSEETVVADPILIDLTSLGGPLGSSARRSRYPSSDLTMQFEAQGVLTGGLGSGMDLVVDAPSSNTLVRRAATKGRSFKRFRRTTREPAQHQLTADILGEIVAVDGGIGVDISNLDGGDAKKEIDTLTMTDQCRSYYFPSDPQMPDWKPFPMRQWFILLLIFLAFAFAAIQEYLCQRSANSSLLTFVDIQDVSNLVFFAWRYLPTIVFVTYGAMWQSTNYEVQRLEAYYQLSRPGGALASRSLNVDYIMSWSFFVPIKSFRYRQWAVLVSSCSTLLASGLVPILQSAALNLYPDRADQREGQSKYVRIDPIWSRLTEAGLIVAALGGIVLLFQLRRKSGLLSDPKGIAGIAAMANRSHILNDFRGLDMAGYDLIHEQLKHRRYLLHKSSLWQGEYVSSKDTNTTETTETRNRQNPHPIMLQLKAGAPYVAFLVLSIAMLPVIMFTNANSVTEKLPWLLTTVAIAIKYIWNTLDLNVRGLEPFYILSCRNAPASTLTMDYTGTVPGWMPLQATLNRNYLVAAVGLGAVLTEILTVCVSSLDVDGKVFVLQDSLPGQLYNSTESLRSFWTSFGLALFILFYLSITAVVVYIKRRHAFLPRQPSTIASILAFIHQSHMLYAFVTPEDWPKGRPRIEEFDSRTMTTYLAKIGNTYGLGWYQGRDGRDHLGIEMEPLLSNYVHGEDWREGRVREVGGWDAY